jgi:hypothetical protein
MPTAIRAPLRFFLSEQRRNLGGNQGQNDRGLDSNRKDVTIFMFGGNWDQLVKAGFSWTKDPW